MPSATSIAARPERWLVAATLVLAPFEITHILTAYEGTARGFNRLVTFAVFDVALLALLVVALPGVVHRLRDRVPGAGTRLVLVLLLGVLVALPFHGSIRGLMLVVRLAGALVLAVVVATMSRGEAVRYVVAPLAIGAAIQGIIAFLQVATGGTLGIPGEVADFAAVGDVVRPGGTMSHPYMLATYALVAVAAVVAFGGRSAAWHAAAFLGAVPIGLSFSRASVVAVALMAFAWAAASLRGFSPLRSLAVAAVAGMVLPAAVFSSGWLERVDDTAGGDLSPARVVQLEQAAEVIRDHPFVGAGPWLYTITVERAYPPGSERGAPVHSVPVLVTAELGVPFGIAFAAALLALGLASVRRGWAETALFAAILGFMVFDVVPYWYPAGLIVLGAWAGLLDHRAAVP